MQKYYYAKDGDNNKTVAKIQSQLKNLGFPSQGETGYYGTQTFNNIVIFQAMNGLEVSGWVDQETGRYLNGETHAQDQEKFEEQTQGELDGQITDLRVGGIYDIKRGHTLHVVLSDQVTKAYVRLTNSQKEQHEQYEVDIETGLVTIMVDSKNDYDCYLYLCGEAGAKKLFQGHINFKDTVEWKNLVKNLLRGLIDAFKDNLVGIWDLVKDPLQIVRAAKFMALAILPGTEERAVLDKMLREDLFDMAYDLVTRTDIEQFCYMAGYLGGEILFTIIIGNVVSKVKDVMPKLIKKLKSVFGKEPPKAVKQAVEEVADQLGDSAKKCAKEAKKVAEKYGDDVQEIAEKSGKVGGGNANTGIGNPVKIEGKGSTGRTIPNSIE